MTTTSRHLAPPVPRRSRRQAAVALTLARVPAAAQSAFKIEEASIAGIQQAIKTGQTTCQQVVQAYIERAKAYNGTCTALVTADGKPIAPATGTVRAGAPLTFPTQTVAVSTILPDLQRVRRACRSSSAGWSRRSPTRACSSSAACASASRTPGS